MRVVRVEEAVGMRLAHDYTCIEPGYKGAIKRRGEIVNQGDVELLRKCGHYYVYVEDNNTGHLGYIHEVDAVKYLGEVISGDNIEVRLAEEGKAYLYSSCNGLLLVDSKQLHKINSTGIFVVVTLRSGSYVKVRNLVGAIDLIPLVIDKRHLDQLVEEIKSRGPVIQVVKSRTPKVAIIVTGTEIVEGIRKDVATPIVVEKLRQYDCRPGQVEFARDDLKEIADKISSLIETHDAIIITGGMSVDPTDYTPKSIELIADEIIAYGIPIKPSTMSMVAYKGSKPIIGVSSGIIHYPDENILDIVLPWVSAGVKITRDFILSLGEGGLMRSFLRRWQHQ